MRQLVQCRNDREFERLGLLPSEVRNSCGNNLHIGGLLEKYPTFSQEKETGLLGALDT